MGSLVEACFSRSLVDARSTLSTRSLVDTRSPVDTRSLVNACAVSLSRKSSLSLVGSENRTMTASIESGGGMESGL